MNDARNAAVMDDVHRIADIARDAVLREAALSLRVGRLEEALREVEDVARIAITWATDANAVFLRNRLETALAAAALVRTGEEHGTGPKLDAPVPGASSGGAS